MSVWDCDAFFGAIAMAPIALAIEGLPGAPPAQATFPAFWLLVPGVLGLIGVTGIVGDPATATVEDLVTPIGAIVSIALGILSGVLLFRATSRRARRAGGRHTAR